MFQLIYRVKKHPLLAFQLAAVLVVISLVSLFIKNQDAFERLPKPQIDLWGIMYNFTVESNQVNVDSREEEWHGTNGVLISGLHKNESWNANKDGYYHPPLLVAEEWNPYSRNPACKNFSLRLYERDSLPLIALASYPGSGNTWLRHLIQMATGIYTGSAYMDVDLLAKGFRGEKETWDCGCTIVQKLHLPYKDDFKFSKGILLIREPLSAIVSFVNFLDSGGRHVGIASPSIFRKREWPQFILHETFSWMKLAKSWIQAPIPLLVVSYENLKENVTSELKRICKFLDHNCPFLSTPCFLENMEGEFHRKLRGFAIKNGPPYPNDTRTQVNSGIQWLNSLLVKYGHETLPMAHFKYL